MYNNDNDVTSNKLLSSLIKGVPKMLDFGQLGVLVKFWKTLKWPYQTTLKYWTNPTFDWFWLYKLIIWVTLYPCHLHTQISDHIWLRTWWKLKFSWSPDTHTQSPSPSISISTVPNCFTSQHCTTIMFNQPSSSSLMSMSSFVYNWVLYNFILINIWKISRIVCCKS